MAALVQPRRGAPAPPPPFSVRPGAPPARPAGDLLPGLVLAGLYAWALGIAVALDVTPDGPAMMLFGSTYAVAVLAAALVRPSWFLPLALAYLPFSKGYPLPVAGITGFNMMNLVLAAGIVAWAGSHARRWRRTRVGLVEMLVALFVAVASLSVIPAHLNGHEPAELVVNYRTWVAPILLFFLARGLVRDRRDVAGLLTVLAWTTFLVCACTWKEGIDRGERGSIESSRVKGVMGQANSMGAFLAYYGVPLLACAVATRSWKRKLPYMAAYLVAARVTLFTFSRGAYLALLGGSATVLLLGSPLLFLAASGAGAAALVVVPAAVPESVRARLAETSNDSLEAESELDRSSSLRLMLWKGGLRMVADQPLLGVGMYRFAEVVPSFTEEMLRPDDPRDAHNAFLLVAAEMGVPSLLLLLLILSLWGVLAVRVYFRRRHPGDRRLALVFLGSLTAVVMSCMVGSRFAEESLIGYFWVLAALLVLTARWPEPRRLRGRRA
jgi:putative inorganic carbon (hco3(-)) transporter